MIPYSVSISVSVSVIPFPDSGFRIPYFSAAACFLCRMGFSAEQLAKWVAESTDVHVGSFYVIFFRLFGLEMLVLFDWF